VSLKHRTAQTQFKSIVKKLFDATQGILHVLFSGLGTNTLKVAQLPSNFSTLNTDEQSSDVSKPVIVEHTSTLSLHTGMLNGIPLPQQVNN